MKEEREDYRGGEGTSKIYDVETGLQNPCRYFTSSKNIKSEVYDGLTT